MSIDTSGQWWVGSEPGDIEEYLHCYLGEDYPVSAFRLAQCGCGSIDFDLLADDNAGCARRVCAKCDQAHFVCDSEEVWESSKPEHWVCVCGHVATNIGAAFVYYDEPDDEGLPVIKWLSIGTRCSSCGTLGCFVGWKVGYSPSHQLLDSV